ncbi:hypothetical protein CL622_05815 [archaeon]|nr:hypothetical protein [archaeon]|tara:strand:+ start:766 stop:1377 length:612 start_codon:yes stop_codon:yes gene_type:complete
MSLIFFDFDGVIIDSFEAAYSVCRGFNPEISKYEYRRMFEGNIFTKLDSHPTAKKYSPQDFGLKYQPLIIDLPFMPGIDVAINKLSGDHDLTIVSSSHSEWVDHYLTSNDLRRHFNEIHGSDVAKDKTKKFKLLIEVYKVKPSECILITDTLGDIIEANEVGVPSLAVTWGFHSKETLDRGEPGIVIHKTGDLVPAIQKHFKL